VSSQLRLTALSESPLPVWCAFYSSALPAAHCSRCIERRVRNLSLRCETDDSCCPQPTAHSAATILYAVVLIVRSTVCAHGGMIREWTVWLASAHVQCTCSGLCLVLDDCNERVCRRLLVRACGSGPLVQIEHSRVSGRPDQTRPCCATIR
jgi:hypothetical protein